MNLNPKDEIQKKIIIYTISFILAITFYLLLSRIRDVLSFFESVISILLPFLLGVGIAFILNQPIKWMEAKLEGINLKVGTSRMISCVVVFIIFILILGFMLWIMVPALLDSLSIFADNISSYSGTLQNLIVEFAGRFNIDVVQVETFISSLNLISQFTNFVQESIGKIFSYSYSAVSMVLKVVIGIAAAFYLSIDKERLLRMIRMIVYAFFSKDNADFIFRYADGAKTIFEQYIVGNLLDSTIVGIVCWIFTLIFQIPYAPMISLFIGITNLIPVFGPFLGAIPTVIILFIIRPFYAVIFAIFILVLQQVDGNVLKPIILGDKLGLSGFWILFAVTIGGSLFGVLGMFLGVPIFALIYEGIRDITEFQLKKRRITVPKEDKN